MLGKLLKYEIKSSARIFFPFFIAIIGLSIINKISFALFPNPSPSFQIPQAMLVLLYVMIIIASFVLCIIITIQRFYKNLVGQEGYLMFTIPVTPAANVLTKGIAALLWIVSNCLVTGISIFILLPDYTWMHEFRTFWPRFIQEFYQVTGLNFNLIMGLIFLLFIVMSCTLILQVYAAISIGQLANDHRLLCSFGAFVGIYIVEQVINTIFMSFFILPQIPNIRVNVNYFAEGFSTYVTSLLVLALVTEAAYAVASFFVTRWILGKRLNLE